MTHPLNEFARKRAALKKDFVTIEVTYISPSVTNGTYTYKALRSLKLKKHDIVVVPMGPANVPMTAKVLTVHKNPLISNVSYQYKWVIGKVDFTTYDDLIHQDEKYLGMLRAEEESRKNNYARLALGYRA